MGDMAEYYSAAQKLIDVIVHTATNVRATMVVGRLVRKHLAAAGYRSEPM